MDQAEGGFGGVLTVRVLDRGLLHLGKHKLALVDSVLPLIRDGINDVVGAVRRHQLIGAARGQAAAQGKGVAGAAVTGILEGDAGVAGVKSEGGDAGVHIVLRGEEHLIPIQFAGQDDIDLQNVVIPAAPQVVALDLPVGGIPHEVPSVLLVCILVVLCFAVIGDGELDGIEFKAEQECHHPESHTGRHGEFVKYKLVVFRVFSGVVRRVVGQNGEGAANADVDKQFDLEHLDSHAHRDFQGGLRGEADPGKIDVAGLPVDLHDPVHNGIAGPEGLVFAIRGVVAAGLIVVHHREFQRVCFTVVLAVHLFRQLDGDSLVAGGADGAGAEALGLVTHRFHIKRAAEMDVDSFFLCGKGKAVSRFAHKEVILLRLVQLVIAHVLLILVIGPSTIKAADFVRQIDILAHDLDAAGLQTGGYLDPEADGDTAVEDGAGGQIDSVGEFQRCCQRQHQLVEEEAVFDGVPLQQQREVHSQTHFKALGNDLTVKVVPAAGVAVTRSPQLIESFTHCVIITPDMVAGIIITLAEQGVPGILEAIDRIFIGVFEGVGLRGAEGVVLLMCKVVLHANIKDVDSHGNCHFQTVGGDGNEVGNAKLQLRQIDLAAHVVFAHRAVGARRIKAGIFMIAVGIAQIPHTHGGGIGRGLRQAGGFHAGQILLRRRPQSIGDRFGCLPHAESEGVIFLHGAEIIGNLLFAFPGQPAVRGHLTHGVVVAQHGAVQIDRLGIRERGAGIGIAFPDGIPCDGLTRNGGRVEIAAQRDVHGGDGGGLCLIHQLTAAGISVVDIAIAQLLVAHGAAVSGGGDSRDEGRNDLRGVGAAGAGGNHKASGQHGVIDLQHNLVVLAVRTQPGGQLGDGVVAVRQRGQHVIGAGVGAFGPGVLIVRWDELAANWINGAVYHAVIVQVDVALDAGNGGQHGVLAGDVIRVVVIEGDIVVEILVSRDGDVLIARVGDAVDQDHVVRVQMEIDGADIFQLRAGLIKAAVSTKNSLRQCAGLFVAEAVFPV